MNFLWDYFGGGDLLGKLFPPKTYLNNLANYHMLTMFSLQISQYYPMISYRCLQACVLHVKTLLIMVTVKC
jgi:hypothetical protein